MTGLQGDDPKYLKLVSTLKHYAVNNVEKDRQSLSAAVSERMLHEYWLPHFRDAIVEGQAQSVMASYNAINGVPSNINPLLLTDILKKQWGFQGFVVSDLGGVNTMVKGHMKGKMTYEDAVAQVPDRRLRFLRQGVRDVHPRRGAPGPAARGAAQRRGLSRDAGPLPPGRVRSARDGALQQDFAERDLQSRAPGVGAQGRPRVHRAADQQRQLPAARQEQARRRSP